jgi:antitoxin component YwqK of YwqJK toxin-antitoxin module
MKVRNGASIVVTSGKTGKVTRTQVSLLDRSRDFNEFSYDFTAMPGDIVKLEFDLGGYTVASGEFKIEEKEDKEVEIVERIPVRNPQTVIVPQAPAKLEYDLYKYNNGKTMLEDSWYRENNKQMYHGAYKYYYENGNIKQDYTYAFGHKIGYARQYASDGKLLEEIFYGDNGVKQYEDRYASAPGGQTGKYDFWGDGKTNKETFIYDDKDVLVSYYNYDGSGVKLFEEFYFNGELETRMYYENGNQRKMEKFKDGKLVNTLDYKQ